MIDLTEEVLRLPLALRLLVFTLSLLAEDLILTTSFESPTASAGDPWYVRLAAAAPALMRAGTAALGTLLVLLMPRFKTVLEYAQKTTINHAWQPWILLHFLAFSALYFFLTAASPGKISNNSLALCEMLGIVAAAFWILAVAPFRVWWVFAKTESRTLGIAAAAGMVAWLGGAVAQTYWKPLASVVFFLAEFLLRLLYPHIVSEPSQLLLGTQGFVVRIAPQCSGYEGIGLVIVFLAIYLWLFRSRLRFPQAFLLFPIGVLMIWIANVLRIVTLIAIGSSYSPALAGGAFHSQAGWISFIGFALAIVAITNRMSFFILGHRKNEVNNPIAMALLVPFLVLLGSGTLAAAFSEGFNRWYPFQVLAVAAALLWYRRVYARWEWTWSWSSVCIGAVAFAFWMALEYITIGNNTTLAANIALMDRSWATLWLGFRVLGSVIVVPLVEEMAFRGYLLRRLSAGEFEDKADSQFNWIAFLLSSAAFGVMHGRWLAGTGAGMAYALAFYRRGSLGDAIVAHMTTNALIALSVLIFGAWSLWS
jgi:exosortase E/protease (VPEID-CTERM system)